MSIGWYAPVVILVGLMLWLRGDVLGSLGSLMFFSLFGGGAAFIVSGASIQPVYFSLCFLLGHVLLTMIFKRDRINVGLKTNGYLAFYCLYSAATAFVLPKLFARTMTLPPLLMSKGDPYLSTPIGPSKQNLTTAIYLIGTLLASICAGAAANNPKSRRMVVTWAMIIAWIHIGFGVLGVVATKVGGGAQVIKFFRNAKYAQLIQADEGYSRINGIFPEPSSYGGYAFILFVFMTELWLRNVSPRWTGRTAAGLLFIIIAATSSGTYVGLVLYAGVLLLRWLLAPGLLTRKIVIVGMGGLTGLFAIVALMAFVPQVAQMMGRLFEAFTTHKLQSASGTQRLFWAEGGLKAFVGSYGLGVGAGTFRCSSLILAIMGSTGVIGTIAFLGHLLKILKPLDGATYRLAGGRDPVAVAAAWAACAGLLPGLVSAPTANPDILFAITGGLALGWLFLSQEQARPALRRPASAVEPRRSISPVTT